MQNWETIAPVSDQRLGFWERFEHQPRALVALICPSESSMASAFPAWSQTTFSLEFSPPFVRPIRRGKAPFLGGSPPAMPLQMRGVDHDGLGVLALARQRREDAIEDAEPASGDEAVVASCAAYSLWRVLPVQAVLDHIDDPADHPPVVDARHAMRHHMELAEKKDHPWQPPESEGLVNHESRTLGLCG